MGPEYSIPVIHNGQPTIIDRMPMTSHPVWVSVSLGAKVLGKGYWVSGLVSF